MPDDNHLSRVARRNDTNRLPGNTDTIRRLGKVHEVTGKITGTNGNCSLSDLAGTEISLRLYYFLHDGTNWKLPPLQPSPRVFRHIPLMVGNKQLQQGEEVASTTIADDGTFSLKWNEVITADRTPYLQVRPISPDYSDPDDPTGFKLTDAMRVYQLKASPTSTAQFVVLIPDIELTFWGEETTKPLPPLQAACFPIDG